MRKTEHIFPNITNTKNKGYIFVNEEKIDSLIGYSVIEEGIFTSTYSCSRFHKHPCGYVLVFPHTRLYARMDGCVPVCIQALPATVWVSLF